MRLPPVKLSMVATGETEHLTVATTVTDISHGRNVLIYKVVIEVKCD
jgi:hypothetical protein